MSYSNPSWLTHITTALTGELTEPVHSYYSGSSNYIDLNEFFPLFIYKSGQ